MKSYILTGEKKIGYISLPDFYSGWEGDSQKGCANDVAKEILKLQKENIASQLQLLKAQVHPHFLFNTLNNIYSLSVEKSNKTPKIILKLSGKFNRGRR